MTSPFAHNPPILIFFTCFGLTGVAACFIVGMPVVANLLIGLWTNVMVERAVTGDESGTKLVDDE
jgi:hypothetical protein